MALVTCPDCGKEVSNAGGGVTRGVLRAIVALGFVLLLVALVAIAGWADARRALDGAADGGGQGADRCVESEASAGRSLKREG